MRTLLILLLTSLVINAQIWRDAAGRRGLGSGGINRATGGAAPVTPISPDDIPSGFRSFAVQSGADINYTGTQISTWSGHWGVPGFDGTQGGNTDTSLHSPSGLVFADYAGTALFSTDHDRYNQSGSGEHTIFAVWGVGTLTSGNYFAGWRINSSNYWNITHLSTDTAVHWRANSNAGTPVDITIFDPAFQDLSGGEGAMEVVAFQYKEAVDSIYAYRSGQKFGYAIPTWTPAATFLNSAGTYVFNNGYNAAQTNSHFGEEYVFDRAFGTDTVNSVCKWIADRWGLEWTRAE